MKEPRKSRKFIESWFEVHGCWNLDWCVCMYHLWLAHVSEFASCVECVPSSCVECVVSCLRIRFVYLTAGSRYACNAGCATVDWHEFGRFVAQRMCLMIKKRANLARFVSCWRVVVLCCLPSFCLPTFFYCLVFNYCWSVVLCFLMFFNTNE